MVDNPGVIYVPPKMQVSEKEIVPDWWLTRSYNVDNETRISSNSP